MPRVGANGGTETAKGNLPDSYPLKMTRSPRGQPSWVFSFAARTIPKARKKETMKKREAGYLAGYPRLPFAISLFRVFVIRFGCGLGPPGCDGSDKPRSLEQPAHRFVEVNALDGVGEQGRDAEHLDVGELLLGR